MAVTDAIPVCHSFISLAPALEAALSQVGAAWDGIAVSGMPHAGAHCRTSVGAFPQTRCPPPHACPGRAAAPPRAARRLLTLRPSMPFIRSWSHTQRSSRARRRACASWGEPSACLHACRRERRSLRASVRGAHHTHPTSGVAGGAAHTCFLAGTMGTTGTVLCPCCRYYQANERLADGELGAGRRFADRIEAAWPDSVALLVRGAGWPCWCVCVGLRHAATCFGV